MQPTLSLFFFILVASSALSTSAHQQRQSYDGHRVLRFPNKDNNNDQKPGHFHGFKLDVWAQSRGWVDVRVPPHLKDAIDALGIEYEVLIPDLQQAIDAEREAIQSRVNASFFEAYRTLDEFESLMDELEQDYPHLVTKKVIGQTVEGRDIKGITITSTTKKQASDKFGIVYNGGQHAREWIGPMVNAWIANELVTGYDQDKEITKLVDEFEWTIVPVLNPDGYVYTWTDDRMWRKNRRYNENSWFGCYGVDNNRNWDFKWGEGGSSPNTCDETYMGPSAGSEPEETAIAEYIKAQGNVKGYIDFHAYSQLWMTPWGYTSQLPKDVEKQTACAKACVEALEAVYGTSFEYGPIATTIYPASGSSVDWTYGVTNVTYSFAVELRDTGRYGFILPPAQIVPSGTETMAAVVAMANFILENE